jgi:hypothetical protein
MVLLELLRPSFVCATLVIVMSGEFELKIGAV